MLTVVHDQESSNEKNDGVGRSLLDGIVRNGARQMLTAALLVEVAAYVDAHAGEVDESGYRLVVRNGYHDERTVLTAAGAVAVKAPRVNDKRVDPQTGERQRFSSAILPAWARKSPQMTEVLPLLYLHGLSSGDFAPALEAFLGTGAGLSASAITRLTVQWQDEARAFAERDLSEVDYVYLWVDGIHLKVRLDQEKLCLLVMIGVRADGRKELVALTDGFRESTESWTDLLRDCRRRGMRAPVLAVGDGALGFWKAVREVFPDTREQRCWWHKQANVLAALPKSAHPGALAALKEIYNAEDIDKARVAIKAFEILRGFDLVIVAVIGVDDSIQLPHELRPQRLGHRGANRRDDPVLPHHDVDDVGLSRPGVEKRLEPTGSDHGGVHIHLGVRIDQGLIALHHDGLVERHRGNRRSQPR